MPLVLKPEQVIKGLEGNGFLYVSQKGLESDVNRYKIVFYKPAANVIL